jgi:hypothetical protein
MKSPSALLWEVARILEVPTIRHNQTEVDALRALADRMEQEPVGFARDDKFGGIELHLTDHGYLTLKHTDVVFTYPPDAAKRIAELETQLAEYKADAENCHQQEPDAWYCCYQGQDPFTVWHKDDAVEEEKSGATVMPMFTSPPDAESRIAALEQQLTAQVNRYSRDMGRLVKAEAKLAAIRQAVDEWVGGVADGQETILKIMDSASPLTQQPAQQPYNKRKIADELIATAQGGFYYGNALYVAMDLAEGKDKEMLHRYLHGSELTSDRIALQDFANRLAQQPEGETK